MKEYLTHEEAYKAMFVFLESYYDRSKSDDIGGLLGSMSLVEGKPIDQALWDDWYEAIDTSLKAHDRAKFELSDKK
ncbi:hypothetical protein [Psychrobacter sp. FDAARGOS_221]|uniref:hypothetical protein n=1 Tax=Psychrobacter sp. FDAARGOS_221 TaxID=1975705 RepID=UPI000BB52C85|nr:hypothetical protein [Psychrobacter sp. FDAARGOS_221]PNK61344.1 hypothetical protein A6J60_011020 [Psychrobacter sp. FDAARGOS_221]